MGTSMRFQALRVLDQSRVEYEFVTDDDKIIRHLFISTWDEGLGIGLVNGDDQWVKAYGSVPGPDIWFEKRWPYVRWGDFALPSVPLLLHLPHCFLDAVRP